MPENILKKIALKTKSKPENGFYYAVDGTVGVGKTSKLERMKTELNALGLCAKNIKSESKEAAVLGKLIFPFLKGDGKCQMCQETNARTMLFLVLVYCNELYEKEIIPHLDSGGIVLCDRDDILTTSVLQPLVELLHCEIEEKEVCDRAKSYFDCLSNIFFHPDLTSIIYGSLESCLARALIRDYSKQMRSYNSDEITIVRKSQDLFIWSAQLYKHCHLIKFPFDDHLKIEEVIKIISLADNDLRQESLLEVCNLHTMGEADYLVRLEMVISILKDISKAKKSGVFVSGCSIEEIDTKVDLLIKELQNCVYKG